MSRLWLAYKLYRYMRYTWAAAYRIAGDHRNADRMLRKHKSFNFFV